MNAAAATTVPVDPAEAQARRARRDLTIAGVFISIAAVLTVVFLVPPESWEYLIAITIAAALAVGTLVLIGEGDMRRPMQTIAIIILCVMGLAVIVSWTGKLISTSKGPSVSISMWQSPEQPQHYAPATSIPLPPPPTMVANGTTAEIGATNLDREYQQGIPSKVDLRSGATIKGFLMPGQTVRLVFHDDPANFRAYTDNTSRTAVFFTQQGINSTLDKRLPNRNVGEDLLVTNTSNTLMATEFAEL